MRGTRTCVTRQSHKLKIATRHDYPTPLKLRRTGRAPHFAQASRDRRNDKLIMEILGKLLKTRVKEIGIGRQADAMAILKLAEEYINGAFSPSLASRFNPAYYKNKILAISSASAPAASELKLHEKSLIDFINLKLKIEDAVLKIRILPA